MYTDGVVEAHNKNDELYGDDRLKGMPDSNRDLPGEQVLEHIFADVNEHAAGVPRFGDIIMVILSVKQGMACVKMRIAPQDLWKRTFSTCRDDAHRGQTGKPGGSQGL
ncbi:MAG: SpoIIE family protein phosphatase [Clostridia bacterium]|nr:SpoIIE family protein phosphatase [Clostridia bacterium]